MKNAIKKGFINSMDEENIRKLWQTVITEYLHQPQKKIKCISKDSQCDIIVGTVQSVFGIKSDANILGSNNCDHIKINE